MSKSTSTSTSNSINKIRNNHLLLVFAVYTLVIFVYKDFGIPTILGYAILAGAILIAVHASDGRASINSMKILFLLFASVQILEILLSYLITGNKSDINLILALLVCICCVVIASPSKVELVRMFRIWDAIAICLALYVVIVKISPSFYWTFVERLLSTESAVKNEITLRNGYGIIVGANFELIDYILAFAFFHNLNSFLIEIKDNQKRAFKSLALALFLFMGIVLEEKKAETLAVLAVAAVLFASKLNYTSLRTLYRRRMIFILAIMCMVTLVLVLHNREMLGRYGMIIDAILTRSAVVGTADVSSGRFRLWSVAWNLFKSNPIFGIGWGEYEHFVPPDVSIYAEYKIRQVHNCYIQLLCETGIVGFVLYVGTLTAMFVKSIKITSLIKRKANDKRLHILAATSVAYQLFFLLEGVLNPTWYKIVYLFFLSIAVIISIACHRIYLCEKDNN